MKKSTIIAFVVLILALVALALLISQVLSSPQENGTKSEDNGNYIELPKSDPVDSTDRVNEQVQAGGSGPQGEQHFRDLVPATAADSTDDDVDGRYLIIAGTFRQKINARTRVRDLIQAGFADTALEIFDRGTYAVALVDRSSSYAEAAELAGRVRSAGFEADVYRKR